MERSDKKIDIDGNTLQIASFSDVPRQPVNFDRSSGYLGKQIRQLQVQLNPPIVSAQAPITIVRRNLLNGTFQYRVQFIAPTAAQDAKYQTTSVLLATPNGITRLAASGGTGPIIFTASQTSAPGSVVLQQNNSNATSETGLGKGNSRTLVQL